MFRWIQTSAVIIGAIFLINAPQAAEKILVNDAPKAAGEWGFRPADGKTIKVTPPGFTWRPQKDAQEYEIQCSRDSDFSNIQYQAKAIEYNVHTPPRTFSPGRWFWRFRFSHDDGSTSEWSRVREFTIAESASSLPLPIKDELLARIPEAHPRLFVRPEQIPELRKRAQGDLKDRFDELVKSSEKILANPPDTTEPPRYPEGMKRKSEGWRKMWWGNRTYTIKALNGAATLAFTRLIGGKDEYGQLAKDILLECAKWDPKGSTGFRYNDEAGMPYNYYFARTYTFVHDLLSKEEREACCKLMAVRGEEMYHHLYPRHLWRPYASHSNRAWHFLGELGIAFHGEIPQADKWAWFAANVFSNVYPVWSDEDGGWHEGLSYWRSYIYRFTWWADVMRTAMDINAFDKPYFSQVGYYAMYLQPPGTQGGGFGDLCASRKSRDNSTVMSIFAAQAQNPYWQWYVDQHGQAPKESGYIGFIRGALPKVESKSPEALPSSRCFKDTGQAMMNSNLLNASDNVELLFKSSPFGTQSHGYESSNSFLLYAFSERLFIRTGKRDIYGSVHHKNWMWHSKSTNCITVNGEGQKGHSASATGEILDFHTDAEIDYVCGEASKAYEGKLKQFTRRMLYIKPEAIVIFDTLQAPQDSTFEWGLHAINQMKIDNQHNILAENGKAACKVNFLWPENLSISQTDKFDPPPRERIKLVEHHLTAATSDKSLNQTFVTVLRPYRSGQSISGTATLAQRGGVYEVTIPLSSGSATAVLTKSSAVQAKIFDQSGSEQKTFTSQR